MTGKGRQGGAGLEMARCGKERQGIAGMAWLGEAARGLAPTGKATQVRRDVARTGKNRHGMAGMVR